MALEENKTWRISFDNSEMEKIEKSEAASNDHSSDWRGWKGVTLNQI